MTEWQFVDIKWADDHIVPVSRIIQPQTKKEAMPPLIYYSLSTTHCLIAFVTPLSLLEDV